MTVFGSIASRGWGLAVALVIGFAGLARAADTPATIDHFYGRYTGGAEIKGNPSEPARRKSEVEVLPTDEGFQLTWTTLSLDTSNVGGVKVKTAVEKFVRTDHPEVFKSEEAGDPMNGKPLTWANITGNTLVMTTLTIWPDGTHDLATWARTVDGDQMHLVFTRLQNGDVARRVEGDLVKVEAVEDE